MSKKLEWILVLKDQVTAPIKGMVSQMSKLHGDLGKNRKGVDRVGQSIDGLHTQLNRLKAGRNGAFRTDHIRPYNGMIEETEKRLRKLESLPAKGKAAGNFSGIVTGMNQSLELVGKLSGALSFTSEIKQIEADTRRMTGLAGSQLSAVTSKAYELGEVFGEDAGQIVRAANTMTKQIGGSYTENLALMQQGFEKGGNLNGDMIDQLKEYAPFVKQLGMEGKEAMAFIIQANQNGIFSDKAFDTLKEGNLSVREMGKAQVEALNGIGLQTSDLAGKTTFEILQLVSQSMQGMNDQAKQVVLADIFKGAGEDAGLAFIEGIGQMNMNIEEIPSIKEAGSGLKAVVANIKSGIAGAVGSIAPWVENIRSLGMGMMEFGQVLSGLNLKTTLLSAKQWILNIAMNANPIGLIVLGIAALIALVAVIVVKYNEWGATLSLLLGPLGLIINLIQSFRRHWDSIVSAFKDGGILQGLKRIGQVILDALLMPIQQLLELASNLPGVGDLAATGASKIAELRRSMDTLPAKVVIEESSASREPATGTMEPVMPFTKNMVPSNVATPLATDPAGPTAGVRYPVVPYDESIKKMPSTVANAIVTAPAAPRDPTAGVTTPVVPSAESTNKMPSTVANAIVTGGKRQQIFNINIEKVLEMRDQIVNDGKVSANELVDMVIDGLTRRMSGTFRNAAQ